MGFFLIGIIRHCGKIGFFSIGLMADGLNVSGANLDEDKLTMFMSSSDQASFVKVERKE